MTDNLEELERLHTLKPACCPFCDEAEELAIHHKREDEGLYQWVTCYTCGAQGPGRTDVCDAIEAWNERIVTAREVEGLRSVLSGLSSYLGAGLGDEATTPEQFDQRIRWGIEHQASVYRDRAASVVEECSKRPGTTWGEVKSAIQNDTFFPEPDNSEVEGLRALLAQSYDMLFNSTAASEGDTTTIILERSEWLRLQEKLRRSTLSEKGIHASDATDPGDSEVENLRADNERLRNLAKNNNALLRIESSYRRQLAFERAEMANALEAITSQYGDRLPAQFLADLTAMLMRHALRAGATLEGKGG